jgi:ribosomal protein S18 acetylase RimI-like enzyme
MAWGKVDAKESNRSSKRNVVEHVGTFQERGALKVDLEVQCENSRAILFYKRLGMIRISD